MMVPTVITQPNRNNPIIGLFSSSDTPFPSPNEPTTPCMKLHTKRKPKKENILPCPRLPPPPSPQEVV